MAIQPQPLSEQEHRAIICVCILAAFADGTQDEVERAQIERIVNGFSEEHLDLASAYQDILAKRYYASGRALSNEQLKGVFASMLREARGMQGRYSGDIAQKSRQVNVSELVPLVR